MTDQRTYQIIGAAEKGLLPDKVMINTHPQLWTGNPLPWVRVGGAECEERNKEKWILMN
jgi:hypothetical protein